METILYFRFQMIDAVNSKKRILDAFERHFKYFGLKKTSVDEVARELRISKKTIYSHFKSKEEIYNRVISHISEKYYNTLAARMENYETFAQKITELIMIIFRDARNWFRNSNDDFDFKYKFEIAETAFREAYSKLLDTLIRWGSEAGEFEAKDPHLTSCLANGIITAGLQLLTQNTNLLIEEKIAESVIKLLR